MARTSSPHSISLPTYFPGLYFPRSQRVFVSVFPFTGLNKESTSMESALRFEMMFIFWRFIFVFVLVGFWFKSRVGPLANIQSKARAKSAPLGKDTRNTTQHFLCHGIYCLVNGKSCLVRGKDCRIGIAEQERDTRKRSWHARYYADRRGKHNANPKTTNTRQPRFNRRGFSFADFLANISRYSDMWICEKVKACVRKSVRIGKADFPPPRHKLGDSLPAHTPC